MEPLQTWWTTELYPTSDEDNFGVVGNFEVVKAADAQATIAALQAQLQTASHDAIRAFVRGEDKMCLVCGAKEPCELKADPCSPCTFEPTPMELLKANQSLVKKVEALQARVQELEESRDAWKASQECSEKAYMALVNQIPAERFDYDPINVALLDGAKEQEIIGRKQIADLQGLLKRTDENREQWRKLCQEAQSQLTQRTAELERVRLLIKALPKVEGEVTVRDITALCWANDGTYGSIDCKEQLVSLLQERQKLC